MRQIQYVLDQRREGVTVNSQYYYVVTSVLSSVEDKSSGFAIPSTAYDTSPLLNLFVIDTQAAKVGDEQNAKFIEDQIVNTRIATPEDFTSNTALVGGTTFLELPRLFFPGTGGSSSGEGIGTDPQTQSSPITPENMILNSMGRVQLDPAGYIAPGSWSASDVSPFFISNIRVDVYLTLNDADIAASSIRQAIQVFQKRYNSIASDYGTSDPTDLLGYRRYNF